MCTAIIKGNLIGRTLDFETPLSFNAIHLPKSFPVAKDLSRGKIKSDYRMMGMIFSNHIPIKDGINEYGLAGVTNLFHMIKPVFNSEIKKEKINLSSLDYLNFALGKYKSVKELREDLKNIHISTVDNHGNKVICPDFHFLFSDSDKDSVIVEPKNGELVIFEDELGVLTNSPPYPNQLKRYKKLMNDKFSIAKDIPGGFDPVARFIRGAIYKKNSDDDFLSVLKVLEALQIPKGVVKNEKYDYFTYTRYISLFDTKLKKMYLESENSPGIFSLSFNDIPENDAVIIGEPDFRIPSLYNDEK